MNADRVDLSGSWSNLWSRLTGSNEGFGDLLSMAAMAGVAILFFALIMAIWKKRRGGGGGGGGNNAFVWVAAIIGALLTAPGFLIPIVLTIADWVINTVAIVFNSYT